MSLTKQQFEKAPNKSTKTTITRGDGSNLFNVTEESWREW